MRRRWMLVVVAVGLLVVGVVVAVNVLASKASYLTAASRATGVQLWSVKLPRSGAQWVWMENDHLVVYVCDHWPYGEVVISPTSGAIVDERRSSTSRSPDWRATGEDGGSAVLWKAPGPGGNGLRLSQEFRYDDATESLVSDEGWSVEVDVSGPSFHIPVLAVDDTVYFIENVGACTGFD